MTGVVTFHIPNYISGQQYCWGKDALKKTTLGIYNQLSNCSPKSMKCEIVWLTISKSIKYRSQSLLLMLLFS